MLRIFDGEFSSARGLKNPEKLLVELLAVPERLGEPMRLKQNALYMMGTLQVVIITGGYTQFLIMKRVV